MIRGKYRYTHLSSGDLLRDEVIIITFPFFFWERGNIIEKEYKMTRRIYQVMLNSARGMQIFGTMEKGNLVPDVSWLMVVVMVGLMVVMVLESVVMVVRIFCFTGCIKKM